MITLRNRLFLLTFIIFIYSIYYLSSIQSKLTTLIMDCPSGTFPTSSSFASSSGDVEPRARLVYSNPLHIGPTSPFPSQNHGLGISYYDSESSTSYPQQYPSSESCTADWAQPVPATISFGCSLNTTSLASAGTFYERYAGSEASASPLSYCGPQAMSTSSSRGSAFDFRAGPDTMNTHPYSFWPNTPCSEPDISIKEDPDADYHNSSYPEHTKPTSMPLFAPVAHHRTGDFLPKLESSEDDTRGPKVISHDTDPNLPTTTSTFPVVVIPPWSTDNEMPHEHDQMRFPPASGLQCTICGTRFTRRSNCREHMRRHDPNARKSFPCEDCGKSLGRKTDLRRHIDSVCIRECPL